MAFPAMFPETPQRALPGTFFNTPAASRFPGAPPQPNFQPLDPRRRPSTSNQSRDPVAPVGPVRQTLQPIQRAARTINEVLQREASFPDLDSYVKQGTSSDYDLPASASTESAWAPFTRTKMYEIPDAIFEQYNRAEVSTMMGLFAELNHAWVTIDNALYLWDYTNPNPDMKGFEDQGNTITAVELVVPRPGVFVKAVNYMLVVATTQEIILLGLAAETDDMGVTSVQVYQTKMSLGIKGLNVQVIATSAASGRLFFAGDNEVFEITYQQDEKWFSSRCGKVNHTSPGYTSLVPSALWAGKSPEHVISMVVDDSRRLLYTLSSESTIRTFHLDSPTTLSQVIEKKRQECLRDISHMLSASSLLTNTMKIVSISPISAQEGTKLHLMATTSTGCRLFLSATRGYGSYNGQGAPQSMQVQHIKFPPQMNARPGQGLISSSAEIPTDTSSLSLSFTRMGLRFPPGFFFCFVQKADSPGRDSLFLSAPDTGRIAAQARDLSTPQTRYFEQGCWLGMQSHAEAVGLVTKPFSAANSPLGFGNELSVQYDQSPSEIAVLTNTGIHIIRRRRLVDVFAAAIRSGGNDEGLDVEVMKFIRQYGRGETIATALAVACGQGSDVSPGDNRIARLNDPETLELARKAFVEFGGRPMLNENMVAEGPSQAIDNVRPSSRHEGLALYIGRLVRSLWKQSVVTQGIAPAGGVMIKSTVNREKLTAVQDELTKLNAFLDKNKTFIEGLSGPESLQRVSSQQEQLALQGEHQALHSLQKLVSSIIEGISFAQMLFDERVDEIWIALDDTFKQNLRDLTYELLFSTDKGKDLAKALVKAIVNRNIANGSNVDTVAEALRRRCGSFCSADDVITFKAQEQLKKASEVGANSDMGRNLLNESLRLFQSVAGSLSFENLEIAVENFAALKFYAGGISLALLVARESDRGNRALAWVSDGKPVGDSRESYFQFRKQCYDLVHRVIRSVDAASAGEPDSIDGRPTLSATKRQEANAEVNNSDDELFQFDLYEWYLSENWVDRLLSVDSPFVVQFLSKSATADVSRADLFWQFHARRENFYEAAIVQLDLAKSDFNIALSKRMEYLSRAKANASTPSPGVGRQARQVLLYEITELLDVANIQDEILTRLKGDPRVHADRKEEVTKPLDGQILNLSDLFNNYADQAGYFDLCLQIYDAADHRTEADITSAWQNLIEEAHSKATSDPTTSHAPYEAIINIMKLMAQRLGGSDLIFNPHLVIPLIERYALTHQREVPADLWIPDLLIDIGFSHEACVMHISNLWFSCVAPFTGQGGKVLASHMVYLVDRWYEECMGRNERVFGSEENVRDIESLLGQIAEGRNGLGGSGVGAQEERQRAEEVRRKISRSFR